MTRVWFAIALYGTTITSAIWMLASVFTHNINGSFYWGLSTIIQGVILKILTR